MADAATITLKAVLLPEEIQTTLKDLTFSFTPADANDKWYYKLVNVRHNASSDLIEGNFLSKSNCLKICFNTKSNTFLTNIPCNIILLMQRHQV